MADSEVKLTLTTKFLVEVPLGKKLGWMYVGGEFPTKAAAVQWIRENIGQCDENGNINLIEEIGKYN